MCYLSFGPNIQYRWTLIQQKVFIRLYIYKKSPITNRLLSNILYYTVIFCINRRWLLEQTTLFHYNWKFLLDASQFTQMWLSSYNYSLTPISCKHTITITLQQKEAKIICLCYLNFKKSYIFYICIFFRNI